MGWLWWIFRSPPGRGAELRRSAAVLVGGARRLIAEHDHCLQGSLVCKCTNGILQVIPVFVGESGDAGQTGRQGEHRLPAAASP
jgi:hypothetical protein